MNENESQIPMAPVFQMIEPIAPLFEALAKATAEFKPVLRTKTVKVTPRTGPPYTFTYAPLENIHDATKAALAENGLTLMDPYYSVPGGYELRTVLAHASGGRIESIQFIAGTRRAYNQDQKEWYDAPLKIQELGSELTYRRRYATQCLLGVNAEDDDDGNAADGNEAIPQPQASRTQAKPPAPPPARLGARGAVQAPLRATRSQAASSNDTEDALSVTTQQALAEIQPGPTRESTNESENALSAEEQAKLAALRQENEQRVHNERLEGLGVSPRSSIQIGHDTVELPDARLPDPEPGTDPKALIVVGGPTGMAIKAALTAAGVGTDNASRVEAIRARIGHDLKLHGPIPYGKARELLGKLADELEAQ